MSKAPTDIFVYYSIAIRRVDNFVNRIFDAGDELVCYFSFAV